MVVDVDSTPSGLYTEFDSHRYAASSQEQAEAAQEGRSSGTPHANQIVRSFSNTFVRVHSYRENQRTIKESLPASTTSAQLQAATTRGEISASQEQIDIERAQRERNAIHYHAGEALKAGNDAAAIKKDDLDRGSDNFSSSTNKPPPLQTISIALEGSSSSIKAQAEPMQQYKVLAAIKGSGNDRSFGSKIRMPWIVTRSTKTIFFARKKDKTPQVDQNSLVAPIPSAPENLEEKILWIKQEVLRESHKRSGSLLDSNSVQPPDPKARARVKLIIENPQQADAYIIMGLQNDMKMDTVGMIRMIDYYCT